MSLEQFVRESNQIEGILHTSTVDIEAHRAFLDEPVTTKSLENLVSKLQPNAVLRDKIGLDVRVGDHIPPKGGPEIREAIDKMTTGLSKCTPWEMHMVYENIHPFTDGNGRSGRALWLHMMGGHTNLGFLHEFYYQTLDALDDE